MMSTHRAGFTLVELMVSIALFSVITLAASSGLVASVARERQVRAEVALQSNIYTFLDQFEYEVHLAQQFGCGALQQSCQNGGGVLVLKDTNGDTVTYQLTDGEISRTENGGAAVTAMANAGGQVTNLRFYVRGATSGTADPDSEQFVLIVTIAGEAATGKALYGYRYITPYSFDVNN